MTHLQQIPNLGPVSLEPSQHCGSQGTGPGEPEVANPQKRKSPRKSCSSRLTFSSRDRFSSAQHSGSSIFLAAHLLQDVFLLPGESIAGSRGVEEGELCDSPGMTGPSTSRNSLFWNYLALIAPEDFQLLQTGFSFLAQCSNSVATWIRSHQLQGLPSAR